ARKAHGCVPSSTTRPAGIYPAARWTPSSTRCLPCFGPSALAGSWNGFEFRSVLAEGDGGQQHKLGFAGSEARVLDHDRPVGFEQRRVVRVAWNRRGIGEIVEPQMLRAARGHRQP